MGRKKKTKLIIDEQKGISTATFQTQLLDTTDIITELDLAPPTKKLMHWKGTGGVEKLFGRPGRPKVSKRVTRFFSKNLVTEPMLDEDDVEQEADQLDLQERLAKKEILQSETLPPPPILIVPVVNHWELGNLEWHSEGHTDDNVAEMDPSILEAPSLEESHADLVTVFKEEPLAGPRTGDAVAGEGSRIITIS